MSGEQLDSSLPNERDTVIDYTALGKRITLLRKRMQLTQDDIGKRLGLSTSFYGNIERGNRVPSLETILRIARVFDTTVEELLTGISPASGLDGHMMRFMHMFDDIMLVVHKHIQELLQNEHR